MIFRFENHKNHLESVKIGQKLVKGVQKLKKMVNFQVKNDEKPLRISQNRLKKQKNISKSRKSIINIEIIREIVR